MLLRVFGATAVQMVLVVLIVHLVLTVPNVQAFEACDDLEPADECSSFKNKGYCDNKQFKAWMGKNCQSTCGLCIPADNKECFDKASSYECGQWKKSGFCHNFNYEEWMHENCKNTCEVCRGGAAYSTTTTTSAPTTTSKPTNYCLDKHSNCKQLTKNNNCKKWKKWMSENCRESCRFCSNSVKGYCHIPYHTMCLYKGLSESCSKNLVYRGISDQAKKDIVDAHNEVRSRIALGKVKGQPPAADMNKLEWNDELSRIAQRLADQCKDEHDRLRNKLDGTQVGQNIYTKPYTAAMSQAVVEAKIKDGVMNWFGEEKKPGFNPKNIQPFKYETGNGHYTQTVWAKTTQVGCGAVHFAEPNGNFPYYYLLVCNYAVAGNYLSAKQMYKQGAACSACMPGREGCENGLCTKKK